MYDKEPPAPDSPLIGHPQLIHTPHLGATTVEAQRNVAIQIVDQTVDALRGADFRNAINMPYSAGPGFDEIRPYMALAEKLGKLQCSLAPAPIRMVEVAVRSDQMDNLIRPVGAAILKGLLDNLVDSVNYINAPILAEERGMTIKQSTNPVGSPDYTNLVTCRVRWDDGERAVAGVLFGSIEPRLVQMDDYCLEANPNGVLLIMQNKDMSGVVGQVGTILAAYQVNIGEWRMGRHEPGGEALSFINLDSMPPLAVLDALERSPAITMVKLVEL